MAEEPIIYIDHSDIHEGALDELKEGVRKLVEFIKERVPQEIAYGFHIDDDAMKMTVLSVHPDSASLELHMEVGTPEFKKLSHLLTLTSMECYGRPSEKVMEQLRAKAKMLGEGDTVVVVGRHAGFIRA